MVFVSDCVDDEEDQEDDNVFVLYDQEEDDNNNDSNTNANQIGNETDAKQTNTTKPDTQITVSTLFFECFSPSQTKLVENVLQGMPSKVHSFHISNNSNVEIDIEQNMNTKVDIHYNSNLVSIQKIIDSLTCLGLKNTSVQHRGNQREEPKKVSVKCRSSFHVQGICCATEVPIVTSIIKKLPGKKAHIYKVSINITNRTVFVEYNPDHVTATDIQNELNKERFGCTIKRDGGAILEKKRRKKAEQAKKGGAGNMPSGSTVDEESGTPVNSPTAVVKIGTVISAGDRGTRSSSFVESTLFEPSLSDDVVEIVGDIFYSNDFLNSGIRHFSPNIASKTIKIEHNPKIISIQNVLDTLKEDIIGRSMFAECTILVDGQREGLLLPDNPHNYGQNLIAGEQDGEEGLRAKFASTGGLSPISSSVKAFGKSFRWFRPCGIGTQHGLSTSIILSGIFWVLSVIGHFTENVLLMYLGLLSVFFGLPPVAKKAFRTLRRKQFDSNCMMVTAALGAVALQEYDEAASVSFLFAISEFLEDRATRKGRKALDEIINMRPDHANLIDQDTGDIDIVAVDELEIGDLVNVRMGDKIPSDGVIVEGETQIDESSLTGESMSLNKVVGDAVSGGTINVGRTRIIVRITASVEDSAVSRLIRLVEESNTNRSPTEQLVDAFARSYTPSVIAVAILMSTLPWFFGVEVGRRWTLNGLIIVVIACPCALTISTPVTYAAGLAATAQKGVIVKGGAKLEALGNVKKIIFDKTGTLTEGKFKLIDLKTIGGKKSRSKVLELLAIMEGPSSHPLAATLVNAAKDEDVKIPKDTSVLSHSTLKGEGVTAIVNGQEIYVGNVRLFKRLGMYDDLSNEEKERANTWNDEGATVGFIGIMGVGVIGMFSVADAARKEAREIVNTLINDGIEVFMLTGDGSGPAGSIAAEVGIPKENVRSQYKPEDKLHHVASLLTSSKQGSLFSEKNLLMMCGDGVNDAPALAAADVGVAMGEGASLALEISDVTLMDSNLSKLLFSIQTGMRVITTVKENICFSVAAKIIVIVLTFMGKMTLLAAIASDVGVMLLVSLNGMKLLPGGSGLSCRRRQRYTTVFQESADIELV